MPHFIPQAGENENLARNRVFFLLKKYTSATLLRRAIDLYDEFLKDFEREIKKPENIRFNLHGKPVPFENELQRFLKFLPPMEYARPLLIDPARRPEAFGMLREAVGFSSFIWGRRYNELDAGEPGTLFYKLGYRWFPYESTEIFGKAGLSFALMALTSKSTSKNGVKKGMVSMGEMHNTRKVMCWTYESIFFDALPSNSIPPIIFPSNLSPCPPKNENNEGQIWSGQTIPITGIWEPWFIDPKLAVGCPNYYLAGDTASQYQLEGTDTFEEVRWRLIWKDNRYADSRISIEEADYFLPEPVGVAPPTRAAYPGKICPETGEWFSNHLNRTVRVVAGQTMPGPELSANGSAVVWYLKLPDQAS
jgi:hypothetical protein